MTQKNQIDPLHGSPYDRGDADRYYGRPYAPHKRVGFQCVEDLTPAEVAEYDRGWEDNRSGQKDWGYEEEYEYEDEDQ
jgi:hypothetical protein